MFRRSVTGCKPQRLLKKINKSLSSGHSQRAVLFTAVTAAATAIRLNMTDRRIQRIVYQSYVPLSLFLLFITTTTTCTSTLIYCGHTHITRKVPTTVVHHCSSVYGIYHHIYNILYSSIGSTDMKNKLLLLLSKRTFDYSIDVSEGRGARCLQHGLSGLI